MQKTLYSLIELQEVDNRLDELREERGDLPLIVEELEEKLKTKNNELGEQQKDLKESKVRLRELELIIEESTAKQKKYEEQLYQVKTNKEYDAITAETESVNTMLKESRQELEDVKKKITRLEEAIEVLDAEISKIEGELEENRQDLESKLSETAEEENLLKQERDIIIKKSDENVIKNYELVRNARSGQGIARVENGVCGGCFSYIPPQKVVEIKKMKVIYTCEFCGRILVYDKSNS